MMKYGVLTTGLLAALYGSCLYPGQSGDGESQFTICQNKYPIVFHMVAGFIQVGTDQFDWITGIRFYLIWHNGAGMNVGRHGSPNLLNLKGGNNGAG